MRCKFCYATFNDLGVVKHDFQKSSQIIKKIAIEGFKKMNFAGGEPTLVTELPELAKLSKQLGMTTTIVTNGARLAINEYYNRLVPHLDWVAISIDSINDLSNTQSGRAVNGKTILSESFYIDLIRKLKLDGVKIKINTVVSKYNYSEDLSEFINKVKPDRWKILQAMPIEGQNSAEKENFEITNEQFEAYIDRNKCISEDIKMVPEHIDYIKGSYIMISPEGCFFDSTSNKHVYSEPILKVGVKKALKQVNFNYELFMKRGGLYAWENTRYSKFNKITISGEVASGKSTVGKLLADHLNYTFISLGNKIREIATNEGLSIVEFQNKCALNPIRDREIDDLFSKECNEKQKLIIDYRLGYKFITNSFNVFLHVDETEAERRLQNTSRYQENHTTVRERNNVTKKQFLNAYHENYTDPNNYDLVINTSEFKSQEEIAVFIYNYLKNGGKYE